MPSHSLRRLPFLGRGLFGGLFELTRRSSRALDSPCALHPELQRYKDTVRCAMLGPGGPRTPSKTADANLDCAFIEYPLLYQDP